MVHLQAAVALAPDLAPAWNNLGIAQAGRGELEAAIRSFTRSLDLDPQQPYVQKSLDELRARDPRHSH
jgi:lipoprotein NlpI